MVQQVAIQRETDIVYAEVDGVSLTLNLAFPDPLPEQPAPLVFFLPGGGWQTRFKPVDANDFLVDKGFITASVTYRVISEATFPAQIHDVKAAVRWFRLNAEKYAIDPERIGVWGHSAGGHLAALLGTSYDVAELEGDANPGVSSRVQAVVAMSGVYTMNHPRRKDPVALVALEEELLGGPLEEKADLARLASPVTHIREGASPFLLIHGPNDDIVPMAHAEFLYDRLVRLNVGATMIPIAGGDHGLSAYWELAEQLVSDFFVRVLSETLS